MSTGNQQSLQKYAQPLNLSTTGKGNTSPLSFREWYDSYRGIIPEQEFAQYNGYLIDWFKTKSNEVTDSKIQLKINYLTLLSQLQLFFTKEETENWYNKVDINNEKELLLSIPYFARKLKDISLYYLQLREAVKKTRLSYNQAGTDTGIVQQIQNHILTNYTQKPSTSISLPATIWSNVPELSSIKDTISVQIEELYDTTNYFDKQPDVDITNYYNIDNKDLQNFLTTKNLSISSAEWIYKLGIYSLSAIDFEQEASALSASSVYQEELYTNLINYSNELAKKYIGSDKFTSLTQPPSTQIDYYSIQLQPENNYFLWPYGAFPEKSKTYPRYTPIPLTAVGLETIATAGSSIDIADTIFVKTTRGIKGAWLRNQDYDYRPVTMQAILDASKKTIFRYPFPGYGLSAEDIDWTGYSTTTDQRFFYLDSTVKQNIQNAYWAGNTSLTSTNDLTINDTTLVDSKAYSSRDYSKADKLKVWYEPPLYNSSAQGGSAKESWLYRFDKTDISIAPNSDSVIVWPFEKINPEIDFPSYYPSNLTNFSAPLPVSAIDFSFATAGNSLSGADAIYKITNYRDSKEQAIECCWLSGSDITLAPGNTNWYIGDTETVQQPSLQLSLSSGNYTKFVWTGPDYTDANTVFKTIKHQSDCLYVNTPNTTYLDHNLCTCKQVMFTPFGHPGNNFNDSGAFTDIIAVDTFSPKEVDINNWYGPGGARYSVSPNFSWYKTNSKQGWGDGSWYSGVSATGNKFYLRTGYRYIYYRANVRTKDKDLVTLPEYIVRHNYNNYLPQYGSKYKWVRGIKNQDGVWQSDNTSSSMTLYPGDILIYSRAGTSTFSVIATATVPQDISENRGSIWSNYDYISVGNNSSGIVKQVTLSYPSNTFLTTTTDKQYPAADISKVLSVHTWTITTPDNSVNVFRNLPVVDFTPIATGVYTASVTVITATVIPTPVVYLSTWSGNTTAERGTFSYVAGTTGFYTFTNIPSITALSATAVVPIATGYNIPMPGYVLNTAIKGWDYNAGTYNAFAGPANAGARPYWAKSYNQKDSYTNYKGIVSWGTPQRFVDGHNIITQPEISDIILKSDTYFEYNRQQTSDIIWTQPIDISVKIDKNSWCTLNASTTSESNLASILNNYKTELVTAPTSDISDIVLENYIDNESTEIYYNAINAFVWDVTATSIIEKTVTTSASPVLAIEASSPWTNFSNQFYPTVAVLPSFEKLYSDTELGGFFTPSNLGISTYVNKDYTTNLSLSASSYFNSNEKIDSRGFTQQDQNSPYVDTQENNIWLKEPTVSGPIAGNIRKDVFKKYQKFLPYQSGYDTNPRSRIGLIHPNSRQTPWGGKEDSEWTDTTNKITSFTGELNIEAWSNTQILKQNGLQIDNWATDVFGNQYGLYKNIKNVSPVNRKNVTGEVWTRKNSQYASPASISLSAVFDTYNSINLINELTGTGIRKIDVFFDTLFVETSGAIILEKIIYDYDNDIIFSLADESRFISLAIPTTNNSSRELTGGNLSSYTFAKAGETWFLPEQKNVTLSICGLDNFILTPELYQYDLNSKNVIKIFPVTNDDISTLQELSSLNLTHIDPPVLSHNTLKREYLFALLGTDSDNNNTIIELKIKDLPVKELDNVTVYKSAKVIGPLNPPVINQSLNIAHSIITDGRAFNFQCIAGNTPATFIPVSVPVWLSLSPTGLFTGTVADLDNTVYYATFKVVNSAGTIYYTLTINVT